MHIALAADGRRIAEPLRDIADGLHDILLRLGFRREGPQRLQLQRGEQGARPGAEVLRGDSPRRSASRR